MTVILYLLQQAFIGIFFLCNGLLAQNKDKKRKRKLIVKKGYFMLVCSSIYSQIFVIIIFSLSSLAVWISGLCWGVHYAPFISLLIAAIDSIQWHHKWQ